MCPPGRPTKPGSLAQNAASPGGRIVATSLSAASSQQASVAPELRTACPTLSGSAAYVVADLRERATLAAVALRAAGHESPRPRVIERGRRGAQAKVAMLHELAFRSKRRQPWFIRAIHH
jgi:hypothetical protein